MRNDLTANFLAAMASDTRAPIQLLAFRFTDGPVYLSDRDYDIEGTFFQGLVENWGTLSTSGDENSVSGTMEMSISIWNGGDFPFSNRFFNEDPMNIQVDVYQTFLGQDAEDVAQIGSFVIQDPIRYDEGSMLLQLDLVTTNMRYFGQVGTLVTRDQFPNALAADVNKPIDLIVGDCGNVQTLCTNTPPKCTLSGSVLEKPTTLATLDDLDDLGFLSAGYLQIDAEIMLYNSRTSSTFNVTLRGTEETIAVEHSDGSEVRQVSGTNSRINVEYIVGQGPVKSISNVLVNGQTPTVWHTTHPNENPAVIRFIAQPTYTEFSRGARSGEVDFDSIGGSNSAYRADYAYNTDYRSFGALINSGDHPRLSIVQQDDALDDGELIKVFLNVEHWATKFYANDICKVYMAGVFLGNLSRPSTRDEVEVTGGSVSIDHGHTHVEGGSHGHPFTNTTLATDNPTHDHTATGFGYTFSDSGDRGLPFVTGAFNSTTTEYINYAGHSDVTTQIIRFRATNQGSGAFRVDFGGKTTEWPGTTTNVDQYLTGEYYATKLTLRIYGAGVVGSSFTVLEATLESTTSSDINHRQTAVEAQRSGTAVVQTQTSGTDKARVAPLKDAADVDDLPEDEVVRDLEDVVTDSSTKKTIDKFDVTSHLSSVSWEWLKNKTVDIYYINGGDGADEVITYCHLEVEYRQKQIRTTDNVTAYVVGHDDVGTRPDAVVQYLLTQKAGVPADKLGSVWRSVATWEDEDTWYDNNVWRDEGQVSGLVPAGALFEEAAAWFRYRQYAIDGVIPGNLSVKDAIARVTLQTRSRLLWQNGMAKLIVLRKSDNWNIARSIGTDDLQLRSLSVEKTPLSEIVNEITLCYDIDRLSDVTGAGQYNESSFLDDQESIYKNGVRVQEDLFLFDLIRKGYMADDIVDYYIWQLGLSRTLYKFITYLTNFDLEKSDYVALTSSGFQNLTDLPLTIRELVRIFGSGKNALINTLAMTGESTRHRIYSIPVIDTVYAYDNLSIEFGFESFFNDIVQLEDELLIVQGKDLTDSVTTYDDFFSIFSVSMKVNDPVNVTDEPIFDMDVVLEDTVIVVDDFALAEELCWGACGWGAPNCEGPVWGSKTIHREVNVDYQGVTDSLVLEHNAPFEDTVMVEDRLCFSDGWGCPTGLGDGFGLSPWGDTGCTNV